MGSKSMSALSSIADGVIVRLGTALSTLLLGYGIHADHVNLVVPAILVIVGVAFDMAVGAVVKRRRA